MTEHYDFLETYDKAFYRVIKLAQQADAVRLMVEPHLHIRAVSERRGNGTACDAFSMSFRTLYR